MNEHELKITIEATLLAAGRPVTTQQLMDLFDERDRPTEEQMQAAFEQIANDYAERGIELVQVASGWRIQVRQRCMEAVSRLWQERPSKYSRALLETLALVAYRQPITRSEIEEIRGVSISSTIMRTLQERNWIRTVGHREVPGRPELLGTTREFLDYFGLRSLDQLPTLAELRDLETIGVQLELPSGEAANGQPDAAGEGAPEAAPVEAEAAASTEAEAADAPLDQSSASEPSGAEVPALEEETKAETSSDGDDDELEASAESDAEAEFEDSEDPELSADADEDEDESATPTLVAADVDENVVERRIGEPPTDA